MAGNLAVSKINGVDISSSPVATQAFANSLLAEYTVSGRAVTSIDFSGLDINTHKSYRVEIEMINATDSQALLYMFVNGDTTLANYASQGLAGVGSTVSSSRLSAPKICINSTSVGSDNAVVVNVTRVAGKCSYISSYVRDIGSTSIVQGEIMWGGKTATVTNITQLTFTSSVAMAIGVGSKIRIYRGDV